MTGNGTEYSSPMYMTGDNLIFDSPTQAVAHAIINDQQTTGSTGVTPVSRDDFQEFWY